VRSSARWVRVETEDEALTLNRSIGEPVGAFRPQIPDAGEL